MGNKKIKIKIKFGPNNLKGFKQLIKLINRCKIEISRQKNQIIIYML